jgi:hypothetical protein
MDAYLVALLIRHHFGEGRSADAVIPTGTIRIETRNPNTTTEVCCVERVLALIYI